MFLVRFSRHRAEIGIRELLRGGVLDGEPLRVGVLAYRVQQVSLPEAAPAVDE